MLANPLFNIPAVLGIGYQASKYVNGGRAAKLATVASAQLSLHGLSADRDGPAVLLSDFRTVKDVDLVSSSLSTAVSITSRNLSVEKYAGSRLPKSTGDLNTNTIAFKKRRGIIFGVLSKNLGDPLETADFSRSEDLGYIFRFGVFADHVGSMSEAAEAS